MYVGSCIHGCTFHINGIQWGDCIQYYTMLYYIISYLANAPVFLYSFIYSLMHVYMGWGESTVVLVNGPDA